MAKAISSMAMAKANGCGNDSVSIAKIHQQWLAV